jgi:LPS O-antigen subunit length determinant protein (WzzB/FepE family)
MLKEKPKATKGSDNRTLSFIAPTAKTVASVLRRMIARKIEDILVENLFGFRRNSDTVNNIITNFGHI